MIQEELVDDNGDPLPTITEAQLKTVQQLEHAYGWGPTARFLPFSIVRPELLTGVVPLKLRYAVFALLLHAVLLLGMVLVKPAVGFVIGEVLPMPGTQGLNEYGADEWTSREVFNYIKTREEFGKNYATAFAAKALAAGVDGHKLLSLDDRALAKAFHVRMVQGGPKGSPLHTGPESKKPSPWPVEFENLLGARQKLRQVIRRHAVDFWEYRAAHMREVHFWIEPLLMNSPRSLSTWLRFFDQHGALDHPTAPGQEPIVQFCVEWVLAPQLPFIRQLLIWDNQAEHWMTHWLDELLTGLLIIDMVVFWLTLIRNRKRFVEILLRSLAFDVLHLCGAALCYLLLWEVYPKTLTLYSFYTTIFMVQPLVLLYRIRVLWLSAPKTALEDDAMLRAMQTGGAKDG